MTGMLCYPQASNHTDRGLKNKMGHGLETEIVTEVAQVISVKVTINITLDTKQSIGQLKEI